MAAQNTAGLDDLDGERPDDPFTVHAGGRLVEFRPAAGPGWRTLLEALSWPPMFIDVFGPAGPDDVAAVESLTVWQMRALLRAWRVHHGLSPDDADHLRLAGMLAKPAGRAAAERDLAEIHHLDLTTEWRARRWRRLLNLLDGLRRASHSHEAMAQDDELAELYLERERRGEDTKPAKRRVSEWSAEVELLSCAVDRLGELIQAQAAGRGARPRKVEPMPRPETALQRVRERRSKRRHAYTVARVFGFIDSKGNPTGKGPVPKGTPPSP
jgi:hypothetical protein